MKLTLIPIIVTLSLMIIPASAFDPFEYLNSVNGYNTDIPKWIEAIDPKVKPDKVIKKLQKSNDKLEKKLKKQCSKAEKWFKKQSNTNNKIKKFNQFSKAIKTLQKCETLSYQYERNMMAIESELTLKEKYFK